MKDGVEEAASHGGFKGPGNFAPLCSRGQEEDELWDAITGVAL